ncbi:DUF4185 domain-containing protein [Nocardioides sp. GXZ039]|uniref:DUF4185 domain-containing protein n=1 Tax=Nocardioides sp. GXZ039 TaxID=3136018 RepID=UPI0030F3D161
MSIRGGVWLALALVVLGVLAILLTGRGALHDAPIAVVAPDVVAVPLAEDVTTATDGTLSVIGMADRAKADQLLEDGDVAAVLVLDLGGTDDELLLASGSSERARTALVEQIGEVSKSYGRTVSVSAPPSSGWSSASLGMLAALLGWLTVIVISVVRGPYAATLREGVARLAVVVAVAASAGGAAGLLAGGPLVALTIALAVTGAGVTTLAAEALIGLPGLAVAAGLLIVTGIPVVTATDTLLMPRPARLVVDGTVTGAVVEALHHQAHSWPSGWPAVTLGGWIVLPLLVLIVSRAVRAEGEPIPPRRWRVSMLAGLVLVTAAAGATRAATSGDPAPPASVRGLATDTACLDTGTVSGVDDLNRVARLRGNNQFQGGDVGVEAKLQDGRIIWLFGDTLRSPDGATEEFVRNSMLVVEPGCLRVLRPVGGGAVLPDRNDKIGYWPMSVTVQHRHNYDVVTVFAQRVQSRGSDVFDFETLGPSAAVFVVPRGRTPQLLTLRDLGADDSDVERPMWGAASMIDDGWLYVYGTARPADDSSFGYSLSVARVRPDQVLQQRRWSYWDGTGWTSHAGQAAALIEPVQGVSQTLSVFRKGDTYYAFSKRDDFLGQDLVFWTSPSPTGPFTAQPPVADLPSDLADGQLRYMPLAHPDLFPAEDSVVVSYSRNSTDLGAVIEDPLLYRPGFLRLPLPRGGS